LGAPIALKDAFIESSVYNAAIRPSYLEDCILDLVIAQDPGTVNSTQDAENFISATLKAWLIFDNDISSDTLIKKITVKYVIFKQTKSVPSGSTLGKLVHKLRDASIEDKVLVIYTRAEKIGKLSLRIPDLDTNDETSMKVLSLLCELACLLHGVSTENLQIWNDPKLDKTPLEISGSLLKQLNRLKASAKNSYGHWDGPNVIFGEESKFKTTPPGLLAAIRLLSSKDVLIRRIPYGTKSKLRAITAFKLQETFNTVIGLKTDKSTSFVHRLLKGILASSVKPHNRGFPGGFVHQNRQQNGVKNESSVLTLLGWVPKVPSQERLESVVFNEVKRTLEKKDGKTFVSSRKLSNLKKEKDRLSLPEFRSLVALTTPKIIFPVATSFDEQLKKSPMDVHPIQVIDNFVENDLQGPVNLMQQAYAIGVAKNNPKSKSTLTHYDNARATFISSTSGLRIRDGKGQVYDKFSDLPEGVQLYFRKRFNYPVVEKRQREDEPAIQATAPMDVDVQVASNTIQPESKKARIETRSSTSQRGRGARGRRT
jgi:hypothetical protein